MAPNTFVCITRSKVAGDGGVVGPVRSHITPATYQASSIFSPSSCQLKPLTLAAWVMSILNTWCTPSASRRWRSASWRTVAKTRAPLAKASPTKARPSPREAPITRTVLTEPPSVLCTSGLSTFGAAGRYSWCALRPVQVSPRCLHRPRCTRWPGHAFCRGSARHAAV